MILPLAFACRSNQAEEIKKKYGYALQSGVGAEDTFSVRSFGEEQPIKVSRQDMAHIIEARV